MYVYLYIYIYCRWRGHVLYRQHCTTLHHTATHSTTLQHTATHSTTLQHTATHCNSDGTVKLWDVRTMQTVKMIQLKEKKMTTMSVHAFAPIMALASDSPLVTVMNTKGESLTSIKYHHGFLAPRIGPVSWVCCGVLRCVAVCCGVLRVLRCVVACCVCCGVLQCCAVCCGVLQRVPPQLSCSAEWI